MQAIHVRSPAVAGCPDGYMATRPPRVSNLWIMVLAMAGEITTTGIRASVLEPENAAAAGGHDPRLEVDQPAVVDRRALRRADAMRVVTDVARRSLADDVLVVILERRVGEDAGAVVALVAQRVVCRALAGVVGDRRTGA